MPMGFVEVVAAVDQPFGHDGIGTPCQVEQQNSIRAFVLMHTV